MTPAQTDYRILFTRPGGKVTIAGPTLEAYRACTGGGIGVENRHMRTRAWMEAAVHCWTSVDGVPAAAAWRWAKAVAWGGLTEAEFNGAALAMERCTPVKLAPEILPLDEVPHDRWFRGAWRRSEKGGPIFIDMVAAREIQAGAILAALDAWNAAARREERRARLLRRRTNGPALIEIEVDVFARRIEAAATPAALKAVWPEDLPRRAGKAAQEQGKWRN